MVKSRGWYYFEDGYYGWFSGLSAMEKKVEVRKHGKILKFEHTN